MRNTVFISVSNREFGDLRAELERVLSKAGFDVVIQPDFPVTASDTVKKLDDIIATSDLLIHLVGTDPGSRSHHSAVSDFFENTDESKFLREFPEVRDNLGDCTHLTYVNWEPWLARSRGIGVMVFAHGGEQQGVHPQQKHLELLKKARCHVNWFSDPVSLIGDVSPAVCHHFKELPPPVPQKLSPSKIARHRAESFFGRNEELDFLDRVWDGRSATNVLSLIAWGGVGKTSLVNHWVQTRFAGKQWQDTEGHPNPLRYFDWSFYDQGTRSDSDDEAGQVASSDLFFDEAFRFFGGENPEHTRRGQALAELIQEHQTLLILDGLEPLQFPPNHPRAGEMVDHDVVDLLGALAMKNPGLCIITSRQNVASLAGYATESAQATNLEELPVETAIRLLQNHSVSGTESELRSACEMVGCHALCITLLGRFLFVLGGDVHNIKKLDLLVADRETRRKRNRSAWKILEGYESWLTSDEGDAEHLAILRLSGLFNRPITPDCLDKLCSSPAISGVTEAIVGLGEFSKNSVLRDLEEAQLIKLVPPQHESVAPPSEVPLDVHPLIREYFARRLKLENPEGWIAAQTRIYTHLVESAPEVTKVSSDPLERMTVRMSSDQLPTLQDLKPLYQAAYHGCQAGLYNDVYENVYQPRILRDVASHSVRALGAWSEDVQLLSGFFERPWDTFHSGLKEELSMDVSRAVGEFLQILGRAEEGIQALNASLPIANQLGMQGTMCSINESLAEAHLLTGDIRAALVSANSAVEAGVAWRSDPDLASSPVRSMSIQNRSLSLMRSVAGRAHILHQAGNIEDSKDQFEEAYSINAKCHLPDLSGVEGFQFVDLYLSPPEKEVWKQILCVSTSSAEEVHELSRICNGALQIANKACAHTNAFGSGVLTTSLNLFGTVRSLLFGDILRDSPVLLSKMDEPEKALVFLREANLTAYLPQGLSAMALYHFLSGRKEIAAQHLEEAEQLSRRNMPLNLADVFLHRARLFRDREALAAARDLINKTGYFRRNEELQDAENSLASAP